MARMYVLSKKVYGDFDIPLYIPKYVSATKQTLKDKCEELNTGRTQQELDDCIEWTVEHNSVQVL